MGQKSGEVPRYLICVRTLALVGGVAAGGVGGVGCSSQRIDSTVDATPPAYDGGFVGVAAYDGGPMGSVLYDGSRMGVAPYDGGQTGTSDVAVVLLDGGGDDGATDARADQGPDAEEDR